MKRIGIQIPDLLYQRLETIADKKGRSLAEVLQEAAKHFVDRFPETEAHAEGWTFPLLDCGGDFLTNPGNAPLEAETIQIRSNP